MNKVNKIKKITALLFALTMGASLVACGGSAPATTTSAPAGETAAAVADNGTPPEQNNAPESDDSFDLTTTKFEYAGPFSEGYAWVREPDSKTFYLIDKNGKKCCFVELDKAPASQDGNAPTPIHDGACYAQTDSTHGKIIDTQGNVLYTLPSEADNKERFCAEGDGYFLLERHNGSFDSNSNGYVVVNKNGEDQTAVVDFEDKNVGYFRYLGDGVFTSDMYDLIDANNPAGLVAKPEDKAFSYSLGLDEEYIIPSKNGKMWITLKEDGQDSKGGMTLLDLHTFDYTIFDGSEYKSYGSYAVADHVYYDIDGNKYDLNSYPHIDKVTGYSPISEKGLIAIELQGEDDDKYLAYVDTQGNEIAAPFKCAGSYGLSYDEDHYCVYENGTLTVYEPDGTQVMQTSADGNCESLGKDYVICDGKYYFF